MVRRGGGIVDVDKDYWRKYAYFTLLNDQIKVEYEDEEEDNGDEIYDEEEEELDEDGIEGVEYDDDEEIEYEDEMEDDVSIIFILLSLIDSSFVSIR